MAGYSGVPPYGGQYHNPPYGAPFQQNPSMFNNMIPQPPPQYGQQQPPFLPSYPPSTGQLSYSNVAAYQNNAQYAPQQFGQVPHPPVPPPQFYNNYGAYGSNNLMYGNGFPQNGLPHNVVNHQGQFQHNHNQQAQDQTISDNPQRTKQQHLPTNFEREIDQPSPGDANRLQELTTLQTLAQNSEEDLHMAAQTIDTHMDNEVVALSSNESSQGQTPMQLDSATTNQSESVLEAALQPTQSAHSSSEESFDPYSAPAHQSVDGTTETPNAATPQSKQLTPANLPGQGITLAEQLSHTFAQTRIESTRQEKKTLAVQAIQDLASRRIGFDQISKEGIDLDLLKELYVESGVPMELPTANISQQPFTTGSPNTTEQTGSKTSQLMASKSAHAHIDQPTIAAVPNFNQPLDIAVKPSVSTSVVAPLAEGSKTAIPQVKDSIEPQTSGVNPRRQDYLAKLQAAKEAVNNKPSLISSTIQTQDRSSYLAKLRAAKEAVKQNPITKPAALEPEPMSQQSSVNPSTLSTAPVAKANIDALILQKLEALRKTQSTGIGQKSQEAPSIDPSIGIGGQLNEEQRPVSSGQPSTIAKLRTPLRTFSADQARNEEVSFFSPATRKGFVGSFPGLPGLSSMPATPTIAERGVVVSSNGESSARDGLRESQPGQYGTSTSQLPAAMSDSSIYQQVLSEQGTSRKRPVAADFINSPPPAKLQRGLSSGPISLVIDVSDDEEDKVESVDDLIRNATVNERRGGPDLPAFSDFLSRSNSYNTPSQVSTPDLQAKEEKIRELKQRIVEATLRKNGKMASGTPAIGKPEKPFAPDIEQAKDLESQQEAMKDGTQELTAQEKALAAAKLQAQRHLEQIRRNQASLNAYANKTQHELDHAGTGAEREQRLRRKAELEARLASVETTITTTEANLQVIKQEQEQLLARINQETTARVAIMDELTQLLKTLEAEASVNANLEPAQVSETKEPAAIEHDSDAQLLGLQVTSHLEREEQNPRGISTTDLPIEEPIHILSSNSSITSKPISSTDDRESSSAELPESDHGDGYADDGDDDHLMEIDEDSEVDNDEYDPENFNFSGSQPDPEGDQSNEQDSDDYLDEYEPTQEIEVLPSVSQDNQRPVSQGLPESYQAGTNSFQNSSLAMAESPAGSSGQRYVIDDSSDESDGYEPPEAVADEMLDTNVVSTSSIQDEGDIDLGTERQVSNKSAEIHKIPDHDVEEIGHVAADEGVVNSTVPSYQHFTPYESALSQFVSYRFHPQYTKTVPGGFRSLTYSHDINPTIELCRWELAGGICNDLRCRLQHFKDLSLTDNNLLLQLGSIHEGRTQEEQEKYVAGLKDTINGMRSRGLKDVDSIASEIVAYRRNFLGDPSRVVANLNVS